MKLNEKIRTMREMRHWSQEAVAEQLNMSKNGYAKIKYGKNRPNIDRQMQIAKLFNIDISDILNSENNGMIFVVGNNSGHSNYYGSASGIAAENEKPTLVITHQEEIIAQKDALLAQQQMKSTP